MRCLDPPESFPLIGTVQNPMFISDGDDLVLCYEVAPVSGGGIAFIRFTDVSEFSLDGWANVRALEDASYFARPWKFSEIKGSPKAGQEPLSRRHWTISFNDLLLSIVFSKVQLLSHSYDKTSVPDALANYMKAR